MSDILEHSPDWIDLGENIIHRTAFIAEGVKLGKGNVIYPYAVIGVRGCIRGEKELEGAVTIGDNNRIGAHTLIAHNVTIGNDNEIMNFVNIGHDSTIGNGNEIGAQSLVLGHVKIGSANRIKASVAIRNRVVVGDETLIAMRSNVLYNVPSRSYLSGNPAK